MPKILDCTLRDGGYINNWNFSSECAKDIIESLKLSGVDFIEVGFYHHNLDGILPDDCSGLFAMVQFLKTPIQNIPNVDDSKIKGLRVIFKKNDSSNALKYCTEIKNRGYKLFINATFINQYNDYELSQLIGKINKIKPYAFTITDSVGAFTSFDVKKICKIIESELDENIALCFHSHNNLGLSFSNAKIVIEQIKTREIIIDSTLYGMGRGAGNLRSEVIMEYLNKNGANYNINPVLKMIDKYIIPHYKENPWGYSIPYYLSALHKCHPDYAKDLIKRKIDLKRMDKIFSSIPYNKKDIYDSNLIFQKLI